MLIADDHDLIRQALRSLLNKEQDITIVAEAKDGLEAVELLKEIKVDVAILDIAMPGLNGVETTRKFKEISPETIVLILTVHDDFEYILDSLEAGASGYLTKDVIGEEIARAIRAVINGESILTQDVMKQLLKYASRYGSNHVNTGINSSLTLREFEILKLVAKGYTNKAIADNLSLSLHTVKKYMMNIFDKLKVGSRTEAVIKGQQIGLLTVNDLE